LVFLLLDRDAKARSNPRVENALSRQTLEFVQIHAPRPASVREARTTPASSRT